LVSIPVSLAYVGQDLLFYTCQFHFFQGMHHKELQSKEDDIFVVGGSVSVISSPRQYIRFAHSMSRVVMKQEVEPSQVQGPTSLTTVKFLGRHEILKVLVIGPDFHQMSAPSKKCLHSSNTQIMASIFLSWIS